MSHFLWIGAKFKLINILLHNEAAMKVCRQRSFYSAACESMWTHKKTCSCTLKLTSCNTQLGVLEFG